MKKREYLIDGQYGITDILDIEELHLLCEDFTKATGFTIGFLDHPGLNILIATGWRDICVKYHRKSPIASENCISSNKHLLNNLNEPGKLVIEKCRNGLVDCAFPIIIKGKHIASLATGQLLTEPPDLEKFRAQAVKFGLDEEEYLQSLKDVPVVSESELLHVTGFLGRMATLLSELGYAKIVIKEESELLKREIEVRERIEKERKTLEVQLRHSQKMESIGRLAGGIAHDFNNMLSIIRGFSDLSLSQIDESHPLYKNIKEISKAAKSSSNIIRQLLIFSGHQNVKPEKLDLNASVKKLLPMLQMLVGKNIELKLYLNDEKTNIKIAPGQLEQILLNLCSNSKKAIKNQGIVKISTHKINRADAEKLFPLSVVSKKQSEYYALISVEDNGCGMEQKVLDNVFEPFFTTGDDSSSSGLGMSTVYGIVKLNSGNIRIRSTINEGTTVELLFPAVII